MTPIIDEQEATFFERPFRTPPHGYRLERHFSTSRWCRNRLERQLQSILRLWGGSSGTCRAFCESGVDSSGTCPAFCRLGVDSSGTRRAFCGFEAATLFKHSVASVWARAAILSNLGHPGELERPFQASFRNHRQVWSCSGASESARSEGHFNHGYTYIYIE